jgi:hypothetical protein
MKRDSSSGVQRQMMGWMAAWIGLVAMGPTNLPAQVPIPKYPRVDLAISYEVDPQWPERPAGMEWGQMPGVAVDRQDRVWIFTRAKPPVQVYDTAGKFLFAWGEDVVGLAHQIRFDQQGNVWLADVGKHVVMQLTPDGKLLRTLGTPNEPGEDDRHLNKPTDMVVTPAGDVFVSDGYGNARVVHFDKDGKFVKAWGKLGTAPGEFNVPHSIVVDSQGRLYVADRNNVRVQVFNQEGKFLAEWRNLLVPWSFWISPSDEIWICGSSPMIWRSTDAVLGCPPKDQLFMKFDTSGKIHQLWTFPKSEDGKEKPGELNWLHSLAFDSQGAVYLVDIIGKRAQKFLPKKPGN